MKNTQNQDDRIAQMTFASVYLLNSWRKVLKLRCCLPQLAAGGRVASAFKVRCILSCLPFCCGLPGSISSGIMRSIHLYAVFRLMLYWPLSSEIESMCFR